MSPRMRKLTAIVSASTLLGGAGVAGAQAATSSSDAPPASQQGGHPPRGGGMPAAALDTIATKLGVTTAKLKAAMEANRPAKPAGGKRDGDPATSGTELRPRSAPTPPRSRRSSTPTARPSRPPSPRRVRSRPRPITPG